MKQSSYEKRIRRLRSNYRKRTAIWAIAMLVIGLVLGLVAGRLLLAPKDEANAPQVAVAPTPTAVSELAAQLPSEAAEPEAADALADLESEGVFIPDGDEGPEADADFEDAFIADAADAVAPIEKAPTATPEPAVTAAPVEEEVSATAEAAVVESTAEPAVATAEPAESTAEPAESTAEPAEAAEATAEPAAPAETAAPAEAAAPEETAAEPAEAAAVNAEAEATAEPAEATAEPAAEATAEPAEATAEPAAEATAESVAEATAEPAAEATAEPAAEATAEPTAEATAEPTAEATPASDAEAAEPADTATPEPEATPAPESDEPVVIPFGDSYEFDTQIKADGTARIKANPDEAFETLHFTMSLRDYMLPADYASKWGNVYRLQGNEAGAGFDLTLHDYAGSAKIEPQNIIKIVFQSKSGSTENAGFQLMDAEISGQPNVVVENDTPKTLWKRYTFSNSEEAMEYLAVTTYNDGNAKTVLFELKSKIAPTPDPKSSYSTLSRGTKSDAVVELQKRLIALGFLEGEADGAYGEMTQNAVSKAQKKLDMEQTGTATAEFQSRLFNELATPEPTERPAD